MVYTEKDMKCLPLKQCYKMIVRVDHVLASKMQRQYELNEHLTNWLYVLTSALIIVVLICIVLFCNIYFRLGVIPDLV
jgi:hypothetical protein